MVTEANGSGTVTGSHTYASAGVYTITITVTDDDGDSADSTFQYVVAYDPSAGFVTGGAWIDSPSGAYTPDSSLTGRAVFGFVSKYQKGANVPTGQTEFQFKVADLNFRSTSYDWLVVAGTRAQYKGVGKINGAGDYGFLLTALDGQVTGGGGVDRFRIKIWDRATGDMVYDNQLGASDDAELSTTLGGGQIVIHKDDQGGTTGSSAFLDEAVLDAAMADPKTPRSRGFAPSQRARFSSSLEGRALNKLNLLTRTAKSTAARASGGENLIQAFISDRSTTIDTALEEIDYAIWPKIVAELELER